MTRNSSNRWTLVLMPLMLLLVCSACQPQAGSSPLSSQTPAAVENNPNDSPAVPQNPTADPVDSGSEPTDRLMTFGSGPFNLTETSIGLSDLSSYQAALTLSFDGTNAGQPNKWSKTYVMVAQKEPAARQLVIEKSGDISDLTPVFMAEMDGALYESGGEDSCIASAVEEGSSLAERMEPAGFLNDLIGADEAGSETVNDVAAKHYTFDDRALGQFERAKSAGELWVAADGGYIVRYKVTTTADEDYFGEGIAGVLTWDYELTGINQPVTINLPENCPDGMVDAPLLPDATNIENLPGSLSFETPSALADSAAFYQEQLPLLGWKLDDEPAIADNTLFMSFSKDDRQLWVTMTADATVTAVIIQLVRSASASEIAP